MLYMYNFVLIKSQVKHQSFLFKMDSVLMKDEFAEVRVEDLFKKKVLGHQWQFILTFFLPSFFAFERRSYLLCFLVL